MDRIEVILYTKLNELEQLEYCKISSVLSFATLNVSVLSKFLFVLIMINKGKVIIVLSRPTLLGHSSIDISTKKLVGRNRTLQIKNNEELWKYTFVQMYSTISHTKLHTKW